MPVKRRRAKRRDDVAELEAWRSWFETGVAFSGELEEFGAVEPQSVWPPENREAAMAVARDAWNRLGAAFLETLSPTDVTKVPWALEQFGEPSCR